MSENRQDGFVGSENDEKNNESCDRPTIVLTDEKSSDGSEREISDNKIKNRDDNDDNHCPHKPLNLLLSQDVNIHNKKEMSSSSTHHHDHTTSFSRHIAPSQSDSDPHLLNQTIENVLGSPLDAHAQGIISVEGNMISFVAHNLNELLKKDLGNSSASSWPPLDVYSRSQSSSSLSSSNSGWSSMPVTGECKSTRYLMSPEEIPAINPNILNEMEQHTKLVATNLNDVMKNFQKQMHKISNSSFQCVSVYKESVDLTCDSVDASIKSCVMCVRSLGLQRTAACKQRAAETVEIYSRKSKLGLDQQGNKKFIKYYWLARESMTYTTSQIQ
ncbi:hypothetical protein HELRODRAFT_188603 [Helobdella robusta]|uniref:BLOC-1-related complex subunit 6 C-terminal helix domain-containing protein n=1 Tax=Helobdella robusta TaxID=6412 RepID=T1FQ61_HELRO|nr:hypothetical protein HELRODRAFT_188603 [Helobdella robusta]ESO02164.1 hypothetical protein HELRODRAFT_188603 [Helobdella robusta]